jgi:hypothetical protein
VQERVEIERDVREEERGPGLGVRGHALEQSQGIADPVGLVGVQHGWVNRRVDVDDFLLRKKIKMFI